MRPDGFTPWEVVLQSDEIRSRFCSQDLVQAIEWSHDKDSHRRFEMALNLDERPLSIWVRATMRHSNGRDASNLPPKVTQETRAEADSQALEAAKRYQGPGSEPIQREHRHMPRHERHERHDRSDRYERRPPAAVPVSPGVPMPPAEPSDSRSARLDCGKEADITDFMPPPVRLHPIPEAIFPERSTSEQSTAFGSKTSESSEDSFVAFTEVKSKVTNKAPVKGEPDMPADLSPRWPPEDALNIGTAKGNFDGNSWSDQHPDDCNHYITFKAGDKVARQRHPQAGGGWAFGICEGAHASGWFPEGFVPE